MIKPWGIPIRIHPLFWLLLALCFMTGYIWNVLIVFLIVFFHELGHTLAAKWIGWEIEEVLLFPFGGVLKVYNQGAESLKEIFIVTIAGPLQHLFIPFISTMLLATPFWSESLHQMTLMYNLTILIFNLFPIWPLDGAKLLSLGLMMVLPLKKAASATHILSAFFLMVLFLLLNIRGFNPESVFLVMFLGLMGWSDWRNSEVLFVKFLLFRWRNTLLSSKTRLIKVSLHDSLAQVTKRFYRHCYHSIQIEETGRRLSEAQVLEYYFIGGFIHKPLSAILDKQ